MGATAGQGILACPSRHALRPVNIARAAAASATPAIIPYTPVKRQAGYDLRLVAPHPVARTAYGRRDEGFLALGSYLSGANASELRFQETQPVVMTYHPGGLKTMQVYLLPRQGQLLQGQALPQPTERGVELDAGGGELLAVARFEGNATQEACERARGQLLMALQADGLRLADAEAAGLFRLAQYGPLHSLATRLNEIWVAVAL